MRVSTLGFQTDASQQMQIAGGGDLPDTDSSCPPASQLQNAADNPGRHGAGQSAERGDLRVAAVPDERQRLELQPARSRSSRSRDATNVMQSARDLALAGQQCRADARAAPGHRHPAAAAAAAAGQHRQQHRRQRQLPVLGRSQHHPALRPVRATRSRTTARTASARCRSAPTSASPAAMRAPTSS